MPKKRILAYGLLSLTALLWGWAAPVIKYTLRFISPIEFLFYRFLLVSLFFIVPFILEIRQKNLHWKDLYSLFLIGLLGGPITLLLIFIGTNYTTSLNSSLIVSISPIFIVLGGAFFLKEEITTREKTGLIFAVFGAIVTVVQPGLASGSGTSKAMIGNLILLVHNFVWAAYCLLVKKKSARFSPTIITAITFFSGLFVLPLLFFPQRFALAPLEPVFKISRQAWPGILYMSVFSSVIAYTTYNWGMSLIEASEGTIFTYLQPIFAAPLSFFWLNEKISPTFLLGTLLIVIGVFLTEYRSGKPLESRRLNKPS
ncbi:DMT family transporter [Patescibacteria group bacterium]